MAIIIYIDMDDVLCDYSGAFDRALKNNPRIEFPQSQYGFYAKLMPIQGAIKSAQKLLKTEQFDSYILTAPSIMNPLSYTEKRVWVENHLGMQFVERLIISPDKGLLRGDILIDDLIAGRGQERFAGKIIQFGSGDFPDWGSVMAYLDSLQSMQT